MQLREELSIQALSLNSEETHSWLLYVVQFLNEILFALTPDQKSLIQSSLSEKTLRLCVEAFDSVYGVLLGESLTLIPNHAEVTNLVYKSGFIGLKVMITFALKLLEIRAALKPAIESAPLLRQFAMIVIEAFMHSCSQFHDFNLFVECLPSQLQLIFATVIQIAMPFADSAMPIDLLRRMKREDLIQMKLSAHRMDYKFHDHHLNDDLDGLNELTEDSKHRFPDDERLNEAVRFLRSSVPVYLKVDRAAEVSDLEYRRKLQMVLLLLCRRALSYPIGRGMLTLGSLVPTVAEPWRFPPLVLSGRLAPTGSIVVLDSSMAPPELTLWPEFHNGMIVE